MIPFNGEMYNDDRMFVLYIARCAIRDRGDGMIDWIVYHEPHPEATLWALVTYRNTGRYPAVRVDGFTTEKEAEEYRKAVESTVPRISLGGAPPSSPPSHEDFVAWKQRLGLAEYDWRALYSESGANRREIITVPKPHR